MYNFIEMGNLIRKYREERDFTIEELAELCDLSYRCISNIERGQSNPKLSSVIKIFFVLDRNLNDLKLFVSTQDMHSEISDCRQNWNRQNYEENRNNRRKTSLPRADVGN